MFHIIYYLIHYNIGSPCQTSLVIATFSVSSLRILTWLKLPIEIGEDKIEYVKEYIYLGQSVSFKNEIQKDMEGRFNEDYKKFWSLKLILLNKTISIKFIKEEVDICMLSLLNIRSTNIGSNEEVFLQATDLPEENEA